MMYLESEIDIGATKDISTGVLEDRGDLIVSRRSNAWDLGVGAVAEGTTSLDLLVSKADSLAEISLSVDLNGDEVVSEGGGVFDGTAGGSREGLSLSRLVI